MELTAKQSRETIRTAEVHMNKPITHTLGKVVYHKGTSLSQTTTKVLQDEAEVRPREGLRVTTQDVCTKIPPRPCCLG